MRHFCFSYTTSDVRGEEGSSKMHCPTVIPCVISAGLALCSGASIVLGADVERRVVSEADHRSMEAVAADARPFPATTSPFARLRTEGIRAVSRGDPEKLAAAGFNLVLPWKQILSGAKKATSPDSSIILRREDFSEESVAELRDWALRCKKNNLVMMYMMYVAAESSVRYLSGVDGDLSRYMRNESGAARMVWSAHEYRHLVDWNGETARWAPCPSERRYWMGLIRPQLELVARVLKETGATGGGALELETYCFYSAYPGMASQKKIFCYCDHCYYGFVRSQGGSEVPEAVRPGYRFDRLTQHGFLPRYETYLEDTLAGLVEEMIREVRKVNAEFLFGMYPYAPFWYYDALIRGSGTPELPCLVFASPEYSGGYMADAPSTYFGDAPTPASVAHLRRRRLPAMYAGGLWAKSMASPDAVAMAMDRMLRGPDGFWIYRDYEIPERLWEQARRMNQWTTANAGPLAAGDVTVDALAAAVDRLPGSAPRGIAVSEGRIVARFDGRGDEIRIIGGHFESDREVSKGWQGRGALPPLDRSVFHSG